MSPTDPYLYDDAPILRNLLGIKDEQELINVEAQILIAGLLDIDSLLQEVDFFDISSIQKIHYHLFSMIYDWAGDFRKVNIQKGEKVLDGLSVQYSDYKTIKKNLIEVYEWAADVKWNHTNSCLAVDFSQFIAKLWKIHPYREGNTRTISVYMTFFAESQGLDFNGQLLSQNASYLRDALVMASIDDYSETNYLEKIIHDALTSNPEPPSQSEKSELEKYNSIGNYEVADYQEMPFSIDKGTNKIADCEDTTKK